MLVLVCVISYLYFKKPNIVTLIASIVYLININIYTDKGFIKFNLNINHNYNIVCKCCIFVILQLSSLFCTSLPNS